MHADKDGGIFYVDAFPASSETTALPQPTAEATVPVSPFPSSLVYHSCPGASNVLYLDFDGEDVIDTAWNSALNQTTISAVAFSSDSDYSTFNEAEQLTIKRVWQRVAEDFAPFNINVTTERPPAFDSRTAHALITRNMGANGMPNPSSTGGGVAYVDVFGTMEYARHRPAWIYFNNLSSVESVMAEAVSHECGHNFGLTHDGQTDGSGYYSGHGAGETSWAPIMGTGYNRNVTQWSKGDYYRANNGQDDIAVIAAKVGFRADDHGDTRNSAAALVITAGTNVIATKLDTDFGNTNSANKGIIERRDDVDVFTFVTGSGEVSLNVSPWVTTSGPRGGNLHVALELRNEAGTVLVATNVSDRTAAGIQIILSEGRYYLFVRNAGVGSPTNSTPSGYTSYGSIGQYFIDGYVAATNQVRPPATEFALNIGVNNPAWGEVNLTNAIFPAGTTVQVEATPATYYQFQNWAGGLNSTNNPVTLVLNTNIALLAVFSEVLTTNQPTPRWWLAANGFTQSMENAVLGLGSNGIPVWQSYIAGLNPNDPASQLSLSFDPQASGRNTVVLKWNPVVGRVYSILSSSDPWGGFTTIPNASNLPPGITGITNLINKNASQMFYRLEVRKP